MKKLVLGLLASVAIAGSAYAQDKLALLFDLGGSLTSLSTRPL